MATRVITVNDILDGHVGLDLECLDRIYLNGWVPNLQVPGQVIGFLTSHLGFPIPSPALLEKIGLRFRKDVDRFAADHDIPVIRFAKGERKLEVMRPHLDRLIREGRTGVAAIGKAQEFARVFTGATYHCEPDGGGAVRFGYHKADRRVTAYYFYLVDEVFGPAFVKVCAYFPYPVKIWLNGHEYAKRAATAAGIGFTELDNGFAATDDPAGLQRLCGGLGPGTIKGFCERWWARLPLPLTDADRAAGYWWDIAMRQVEVSRTIVFTAPRHARGFFEALCADNLDIGRPDQIELIFSRHPVRRGRPPSVQQVFKTSVVTRGVDVTVNALYKHSRIKQYLRDGRALRVGRVAATHCCAAAPSGPCMRVPAHTAQAGPSGCSGRPLLFHGASCCPGGASGPDTGGVYEVCSSVARRAGRAVVGQVVHFDRLLGDPLEPPFPALGGLGWLVEVQEVVPAQGALSRLPGEQADGVGVQRGFDLPSALGPVLGQVGIIW